MNLHARRALTRGITWILLSETLFAIMRLATRWGAADVPGLEIGAARFLGGAAVALTLGTSYMSFRPYITALPAMIRLKGG